MLFAREGTQAFSTCNDQKVPRRRRYLCRAVQGSLSPHLIRVREISIVLRGYEVAIYLQRPSICSTSTCTHMAVRQAG